MRQITFLGSTSNNYLFGRGKDKRRRKQKRENTVVGAEARLLGGTIGSGVGTIRGFKQKNKTKDKK